MVSSREVFVCQSKACRKGGSVEVLAAFESNPAPDVAITGSGCLGECGDGPMVLVMPDMIWYGYVHPDEVPGIVEQHLRQGQPIQAKRYQASP